MNTHQEIWNKTLDTLEQQIGTQTLDLWFKPIRLIDIKGADVTLEVPNRFFKEWIEDNYYPLLSTTMQIYTKNKVDIKFTLSEKATQPPSEIGKSEAKRKQAEGAGIFLNEKYIFDNFVVGECNRFANAVSNIVAEYPGKKYNPLFIYGGVGLGKTHLMHAIGNYILDRGSKKKILYMATNQFMNEYIYALRNGTISEFKKRNSELEVLLIDDVQFLTGKESTQDELFHTFNTLYASQRQIVFSSDRPPKEISSITERLRSRFGMGLIADIGPPDVETKMAILWKKSEAEGINMPEDVVVYLAANIKSNVRELESCLIRLGAYSSLSGRPISLDMAKSILKDVIHQEEIQLNPGSIQKVVSELFGVKVQDIKTKKRTREIVIPRQIAMYLCKQLTDCSLADIGKQFGGKDHATVIHACKQVESRMKNEDDFKRKIEYLIQKIKG
ncbi:MAG TPA: chromosomal replication initiator protein DnaA [Thermodesulfovibrionia bacterium]|nr:chromosomal replication initiator protein DnaA [Thermodesulfovibrionia bacterium]